jgi:hypothetical protein
VNLILEKLPPDAAVQNRKQRLPALSSVRRIARLRHEIPLHVEKLAVVVVLQLAQLYKVQARFRRVVDVEIDDEVALGRFQQHRHGSRVVDADQGWFLFRRSSIGAVGNQ